MKVEVQLFATLRRYCPSREGPFSMELTEGDGVARVVEAMGIPSNVERVILVNGRPAEPDTILREGDKVVIFPPVAGG